MPRASYQLALIYWDDNNGPIPRGIPAAPPAPARRFTEVLSDADVSGVPALTVQRGVARFVLPPSRRAAGFADHSHSCKAGQAIQNAVVLATCVRCPSRGSL